jgi:lipoprotein-anchoring transpeptidase ErfK/SrfK
MRPSISILVLAAILTACSPQSSSSASSSPPAKVAAAPTAAQSQAQRLAWINSAAFNPARPPPSPSSDQTSATANSPDPVLIRTEVLLSRARFSPGVIDGRPGSNMTDALKAYQAAHQLNPTGELDAQTWRALTSPPTAAAPAFDAYTITPQDVAGPFAPNVGEDFVKLAAQPEGPLYSSPLQELAGRFHMSEALLTALNPGVDFKTAGVQILVADAVEPPLQKGDVARIEVSKAKASVFAYDAAGQVIAFYPATVGSTERPSPTGTHKVVGVARDPDYIYDPAKLHWGPRAHGRLRIKPGPNNPVGLVWIALNAPDYGIHGSPDPNLIGKTASHGCVRLTNWDALGLAAGVKPGVIVHFEGSRAGAKAR